MKGWVDYSKRSRQQKTSMFTLATGPRDTQRIDVSYPTWIVLVTDSDYGHVYNEMDADWQ